MPPRILVLGAGFGGLELCSILSEKLGAEVEVTLIDRADAFTFGYSKLDVMFGHAALEEVRLPYRRFLKPGVRFLQESIVSFDPVARRVVTDRGEYTGDHVVVALGAEHDLAATPGLSEATEFYSVAGAAQLGRMLPAFPGGRVLIAVGGVPFKCPPAPSEAALMMHDYLTRRGLRAASEITLVLPFKLPVPPSPEMSRALLGAFAERGITFTPERLLRRVDAARRVATLDDGREVPYDLLLGVPAIRAPRVLEGCGLTADGFVPVDPKTLATAFPGVYAIGDCARQGTPKAGVFAEGAARAVAAGLIAQLRGGTPDAVHRGTGSCYIEFGAGRIGRVDIDFFSNPAGPVGIYHEPSVALREDKEAFGSTRRARWFGL
jgi:sulfide:quinone oxidoreductase